MTKVIVFESQPLYERASVLDLEGFLSTCFDIPATGALMPRGFLI